MRGNAIHGASQFMPVRAIHCKAVPCPSFNNMPTGIYHPQHVDIISQIYHPLKADIIAMPCIALGGYHIARYIIR